MRGSCIALNSNNRVGQRQNKYCTNWMGVIVLMPFSSSSMLTVMAMISYYCKLVRNSQLQEFPCFDSNHETANICVFLISSVPSRQENQIK